MNYFLFVNWNVNPELAQIGSIHLRWYSLMFVISFILGMYIYKRMIVREGKPLALTENILMPIFLGTLLGARLGHCLFYDSAYFLSHPVEIFWPFRDGRFIGYQGLASHGAAIGILIGAYYYSRKNKLPYLWTMDRLVIMVAMAGFFIRIGNLMNSEIYGHQTQLPWGFVFARAGETVPKHPTQLYEAFAYLLIFALLYLVYLRKRPPFNNGVIFGLFLVLLFTARFLIEFVKEVQVDFESTMPLNMGQLMSIPFIVAGAALIWKNWLGDKQRA